MFMKNRLLLVGKVENFLGSQNTGGLHHHSLRGSHGESDKFSEVALAREK